MSKRSTKQKRAIDEVLHNALGPLSAQEIQTQASGICSGLSLATVYRVVREGAEAGELSVVRLEDNIARYEDVDRHHHHHFLCENCERVFDISSPCKVVATHVPDGFAVTRHEITLYGSCPDCSVGQGNSPA